MATAGDTHRLPRPAAAPAPALVGSVRRWAPAGLCVLVVGLVALAAARSGGYFPQDYLLVGALALGGSAAGLLLAPSDWRPTTPALVALGCLVGLAAWTGLSAGWSPDPGGADLAMGRTLGYAAAFLLAVLAVGDGRHVTLLLRLLVLVLAGIAVIALLGRLQPGVFGTESSVAFPAQGRLGSVITYWNGLGAITAMAVIGAVGLAGDAREHVAVRAVAVAAGVLAVGAMYLTLSRGTGLALGAGLMVVLVLSPRRLRLATAAVLVLGGGLLAILVLRQHPVLIDMPGTQAQRDDAGAAVLRLLLPLAALAGAAQVGVARIPLSRRPAGADEARPRAAVPPLLAALPFVVALLALVGMYAAVGDRVEGGANDRAGGVRSFVDRQYDSFMNPVAPVAGGQARLASTQSSRSDAYRVALRGFTAHPLAGDGAAGYRVRWFRDRRGGEDLRNAHSLELETLSELGIVGGALLLGFLGSLVYGLRALVRRRSTITRTQAAAAGGIVVVWLVHSALDWDWQLTAVTLPALVCGALCLAPDREDARPVRRRRRRSGSRSRRPARA